MTPTPLADLLLQPGQSGAFYLTASDLAPLQDAAAELDFCCAHVTLHGCQDKRDLLQRIASVLEFPEGFGGNWDALADSLGDLSWLAARGYVLGLEHSQAFRAQHPGDYAALVSVLEDVADAWRDQGVPFWAFITVPDADFAAVES
ncbi:MAG: barstar family protein [Arenimonas sp.]|nr:barstar family protein [Arenimonas sp.]MBP6626290.1 barstar family protein [Arenimonas sp.]